MELSEDGSSMFEYYFNSIKDLSIISKPNNVISDSVVGDDKHLISGALSTVRCS